MAEDIQQIRDFLDRLRRRERVLLIAIGLLWSLAALAGGGLLVSGVLSAGGSRSTGLTLSALVVGGALGAGGGALSGWRSSGDIQRQARLVEGLVPALRSRLLTAVDWANKQQAAVSAALIRRATARARELALQVEPRSVHSARPARNAGAIFAAALLLLVLGDLLLPVGPREAVAVLLRGRAAVAAQQQADQLATSSELAIVGDIVLQYTFPEYTGLEPLEVPNSDGTIHAPPGTRVRITARTAEPFEAAALQVDDAPAEEVTFRDGRSIEATLDVAGEGVYRFILARGQEVVPSPDYRIVVDEDAEPVVAVNGKEELPVPVNQPLRLQWSARDDFGIKRVVLEVEQDGMVMEHELRSPLDSTAELSGSILLSPADLGLSSGSEVTMRVVAYDNDWMAGGKRGESTVVQMTVLGPRAQGQRLANYVKDLRDAMVLVLADFLVEPVPPSRSNEGMLRWAEQTRKRYDPIRDLVKRQYGDDAPSSVDGQKVSDVLESGARLIRFTVTTYDPASGRRITDRDQQTFIDLHAEQIDELEQAIFLLDMMVQRVGLQELASQAAELAREARELQEFSETDPTAAALLARLDQLQRLLGSLERASQKLDEGSLREFVNSRSDEAENLISQIREAIAEGRMEDAQAMLDQLAEQMEQLSEGLGEQMNGQQQGDDEMREQFEQLMDELEELSEQQQELAEELAEARQQEGDQAAELAQAWEEILALAESAERSARDALEASGDGAGWRIASVSRMTRFQETTSGVLDAVRARDAAATLVRVEGALRQGQHASSAIDNELRRSRPAQEAVPDGVMVASQHSGAAMEDLEELLELLQQMMDSEFTESEQMQQLAQQLAQQQQQLNASQQQMQQQVQQFEQQMPTSDGQASESMEQAGDAMQRAQQRLAEGQSMPGEGHQRDAAGQLQNARDSLEQQMQQYQQMQQRMQQMQGEQEGERPDGEEQSGEDFAREMFEIPAPEEFQTPEEYRRALLEGMEAAVPEEYQALKKRYYEELVRQ
jgi:hypothetical protein